MKILVMGAGALGSSVGGFLAKNNEVTLIAREKHVNAISKDGLKITGVMGNHHIKEIKAQTDLESIPEQDLILVTTKSMDTEAVAKQILPILNEKTIILSLQNGIGNEEHLEEICKRKVLGGIVVMGFAVTKPGEVEVTAIGDITRIGEMSDTLSERVKTIAKIFNDTGLKTEGVDNIHHFLWTKFMYNCVLNSLGALLNIEYGKITNPHLWSIGMSIIEEAFSVAKANGVTLDWKSPKDYEQYLKGVVKKVAKHRASMLQDLELGRKTEIDFLNGKIVELGKKHNIPTPVNDVLTKLIKFKES